MSKLYFTYNQIHDDVRKISNDVEKFNADIIIAIGGGLIPACILQTYHKLPIYTVTLQPYSDDGVSSKIRVCQWLDDISVIENKRVLIIDKIHTALLINTKLLFGNTLL